MTLKIEKSQLKFQASKDTGELIGFVSRNSRTRKLNGVRETSRFGKSICVLSSHLKDIVIPDTLYAVELKPMHHRNGYVVISAEPVLFPVQMETLIVPKALYQVQITFGNKTIYYDPKDGNTPSSRTVDGVVGVLSRRRDIAAIESVLADFRSRAALLIRKMQNDGYVNIR